MSDPGGGIRLDSPDVPPAELIPSESAPASGAPVAASPVPSVFGVTSRRAHEAIDTLERRMAQHPAVRLHWKHVFTPGLYGRTIFMPANSLVTSRIHRTEHQFVLAKGSCSVWVDGTGWVRMEAPWLGITKPGTRRVLLIHEDCVWTTFHATKITDPVEWEQVNIDPREDHLGDVAIPVPEGDAPTDNPLSLFVLPPAPEGKALCQ